MSTVTFRHENQKSFKQKGVKHLIKESIIDGEKGLSFVFTKKSGDKFTRIHVKETSKDNFEVKEKIDEKETTKEIDMPELKKMLKSNKDLDFVKNYVDSERGSYKGKSSNKRGGGVSNHGESGLLLDTPPDSGSGSGLLLDTPTGTGLQVQSGGKKKASKKASKKSSKKSSMKGGAVGKKKASKKASKKSSKKASKKSSMKGGAVGKKKASKKASKKSSKKLSMKGGAVEKKKASKKASKKSSKKSSKKGGAIEHQSSQSGGKKKASKKASKKSSKKGGANETKRSSKKKSNHNLSRDCEPGTPGC